MADLSAGVDTDGTRDYDSIHLSIVGEMQDLTDGGGDTMTILAIASAGTADTTTVSVNGFITSPTNWVRVKADTGHEAQIDQWIGTIFRLQAAFGAQAFAIVDPNVFVQFLQIYNETSGGNGVAASQDNSVVDSCRIRITGGGVGIFCNDASVDVEFINNLIYKTDGATAGSEGIYIQNATTALIANNLIHGFDDGVERDAGTVKVINNTLIANTTNVDATAGTTVQYNLADSDLNTQFGESTNQQYSGSDWDNEVVDYANNDYTPVAAGNGEDNGIGPGADSDVPVLDIAGASRSGSTCDIGPAEISSATPWTMSLTEGITMSDTPVGPLVIPSSITEGILTSDTPTGPLVIPAGITEGIDLSDTLGATAILRMNLTEGMTLSDVLSSAVNSLMSLTEGLKLSDIIVDETEALPPGEVTVTLSSDRATITVEADRSEITVSSGRSSITISRG